MKAIKPLKTERDYDAALTAIEELWGAEPNSADADRFDVVVTLVEEYEEDHWPIDLPDSIAAIILRMEQLGIVRRDPEPYIGSRPRAPEVLGGRRSLTLPMIRRLHAGLGMPPEC